MHQSNCSCQLDDTLNEITILITYHCSLTGSDSSPKSHQVWSEDS